MNYLLKTLTIIAFLCSTVGCREEAVLKENYHLQFSFISKSSLGNRDSPGTPSTVVLLPASLLVTIEDEQGNTIEANKIIPLRFSNSGYETRNVDLKDGLYRFTQFSVLDTEGKAILSTPEKNSPQAKSVTQPLPFYFSASKKNCTKVVLEVVD